MACKFFGFGLRAVVSVSMAVTALAFRPATPAAAAWLSPEKQLTTNAAYTGMPDISGTKIVYSDYRNQHEVGDPDDPDILYDIRLLDLKTGKDRNLTPKHSAYGDAVISGNRVVWTDYGNGKSTFGIWYHNLSNGTHKRLLSGSQPRIDGTRMCFDKGRRIYVYSFSTRKTTVVSPKNMNAGACDISGTTVVWQGYFKGATRTDVFSYNLSTKKRSQLTKSPADPGLPRIDGKLVVWMDDRNSADNADIYSYNLSTHKESPVAIAADMQGFPAVSAGRVVWQDNRNGGNSDIYLYDVAPGVETRVSKSDSGWNAAVSGNRIVYQYEKSGQSHVFLSTITPPVVKAGAPKSVAKGSTPHVSGTLMTAGSLPIAGKQVQLQYSSNGSTWHAGTTALTNIEGKFTITGPAIVKATYFRVRFVGTTDFAPAVSGKAKVKVT